MRNTPVFLIAAIGATLIYDIQIDDYCATLPNKSAEGGTAFLSPSFETGDLLLLPIPELVLFARAAAFGMTISLLRRASKPETKYLRRLPLQLDR